MSYHTQLSEQELHPREAGSGLWDTDPQQSSITKHTEITQERYLDYFCPQCWSFEDLLQTQPEDGRDWSFMQVPIEKGKKIGKVPGPDNIQKKLIKTMSPEQLRVIQLWLNEVLPEGKPITKVTEKEMTGKMTILHRRGSKTDLSCHWRPVVLLNCTSQLITYIVNERLKEMVETTYILSQSQGVFRQNKSTDINGYKLYGLTNETQCLKKRILWVYIDFKSAFNETDFPLDHPRYLGFWSHGNDGISKDWSGYGDKDTKHCGN